MFATVCVLSYERLAFLKDCIGSMLARADADFELVVHDDGSRDPELRRWLLQMSEEGVISTLLMNSPGWNEGQGIAFNRMAAVAKGDPIIKCDQDLIFDSGWLRKVQAVLEENQAEGFEGCVHTGGCPHPEECDPTHPVCEDRAPLIGALGIFRYPVEPVKYEEMLIAEHGGWQEHRDFVGSFIAIPRTAWELFGPWSERSAAFAEDNEFKLKIAATEGWCCALTTEELAMNQGFGVGPSTLVLGYEPGEVKEIKPGPKVYEPQGV
jgi:glycosyltransferase involved in cell wall biosynthesis